MHAFIQSSRTEFEQARKQFAWEFDQARKQFACEVIGVQTDVSSIQQDMRSLWGRLQEVDDAVHALRSSSKAAEKDFCDQQAAASESRKGLKRGGNSDLARRQCQPRALRRGSCEMTAI